jgi:hypothetical protein
MSAPGTLPLPSFSSFAAVWIPGLGVAGVWQCVVQRLGFSSLDVDVKQLGSIRIQILILRPEPRLDKESRVELFKCQVRFCLL